MTHLPSLRSGLIETFLFPEPHVHEKNFKFFFFNLKGRLKNTLILFLGNAQGCKETGGIILMFKVIIFCTLVHAVACYPKDQRLFVALGSPRACKKMGWSLTAVAPRAISSHSAVLQLIFVFVWSVINVQCFHDLIFCRHGAAYDDQPILSCRGWSIIWFVKVREVICNFCVSIF